jgi:hypothetical protein
MNLSATFFIVSRILVEKYKLQGLLVILEAKKGYFSLTNELVDITTMIKMLLQHSNKSGKSGLTVFSDMGLFFHHNKLDELLKHETRLFMSSSWITNSKMKIFCCYNVSDLKLLTDNQKKTYLIIIIESSVHSHYCQLIVLGQYEEQTTMGVYHHSTSTRQQRKSKSPENYLECHH